jgi:hypothetical protein
VRSDVAVAVAGGLALIAALAGTGLAWWMHRRTNLSPRNVYLAWCAGVVAVACTVALGAPALLVGLVPAVLAITVAAVLARRWRLSALGAGGELREFELARVMAWSRQRRLTARSPDGDRVYIASQGQLVRERRWPRGVRALPMSADGRGLIPLGEGLHLYFVGATGAGKTTSARRWLLARGLAEPETALIALDPKGDAGLERDLRAIAAHTGRPFVLFDPFEEATDRWNPICIKTAPLRRSRSLACAPARRPLRAPGAPRRRRPQPGEASGAWSVIPPERSGKLSASARWRAVAMGRRRSRSCRGLGRR